MKITLKLNIGNYQSLDIESDDLPTKANCYEQICRVLKDWEGITDNATQLIGVFAVHIPDIEYPIEKLEVTEEVEEEKLEITEEVLMDLNDVIFMAESTKAVLVVKKGFQKWVAFSLIEEPKEFTLGFQGNIVLRKKKDSEKTDPENWFHNKPWEKFKPQKKGG